MRQSGSALLFALLTCIATAASLEHGRRYSAGERVDSPWSGVSFAVPAGYAGGYDPATRAVLLESPEAVVGVYAFSEGNLEEVAAVVVGLIEAGGIRLMPESEAAPDERTLEGRYVALTEDGPGRLHARARAGEGGNVFVVAALGRPDAGPALDELLETVFGSLQWRAPAAAAWRERLAGVRLEGGGSDSEYSPGGAGGGGSYASGTDEWMEFCADGSYAYHLFKESYMSIAGASAERTEQDDHQGRWWLVSDIGGRAVLVLEATDGREFHWSLEETDTGANVEGVSYRSGPATRCG